MRLTPIHRMPEDKPDVIVNGLRCHVREIVPGAAGYSVDGLLGPNRFAFEWLGPRFPSAIRFLAAPFTGVNG